MVKVDFGAKLKNIDGNNFLDQDGKGNAIPATLGRVAVGVLVAPTEEKATAMDKIRMAVLAQEAYKESVSELKEEDVEFLKKLLGEKLRLPMLVAKCYEVLESS